MKEKFPSWSTMNQAAKIYELLNPNSKDIDDVPHAYTISDIFRYLPHSIEFEGHRGDLSISTVDIAYFSVGPDWKHVMVHFEPIPLGGDVYDAFIDMIAWLKKNNLLVMNE